jgi:ABC-type glycerol-3-phosphate transport system permease component
MKHQRGVTFVGMIFIAALIILGAIIALKLVPAYIEYATVVQHLREIARSPDARGGSPREIRTLFSKRAQIDNLRAVAAEDIEVTRDGNSVVLSASYQTKVKLFGNLSACIDFEARSSK